MDSGEFSGFVESCHSPLLNTADEVSDVYERIMWHVMTNDDLAKRSARYQANLHDKRPDIPNTGKQRKFEITI